MARKKKGNPISGWFLLDKQTGDQSTWATSKVKRLFDAQKAGHGGTLDPFAEGLLPIALGEATKTMSYILDDEKEYKFTVQFGTATDSYDLDGEITEKNEIYPTAEEILQALPEFMGEIQQIPPKFSAVKVNGQRAYDLARAGEEFELQTRTVFIKDLDMIDCQPTSATFRMGCTKGTYVRSFAVDLAARLGAIAHLSYLRRTSVGVFSEKDAILLAKLEEKEHKAEMLLPIEAGLSGISVISLNDLERAHILQGRRVSLLKRGDLTILDNFENGELLLATGLQKAVALVEYDSGELSPKRIFNN